MSKVLYFNLNYYCNCDCVFCAANVAPAFSLSKPQVDIFDFIQSFEMRDAAKGDIVLLSGGEPTLFPDLEWLLKYLAMKPVRTCIQTNGMRFSDKEYAARILSRGVHQLSIPLYGPSSSSHDGLTRSPGSFEKTIAGIENLLSLRQDYAYEVVIDLKLLVSRVTIPYNLQTLQLIHRMSPGPDFVSVKHIVVSEKVKRNERQLVPHISETKQHVNELVGFAKEHGIELTLFEIPLCLLTEDNILYIIGTHKNRHFVNAPLTCIYGDYAVNNLQLSLCSVENCLSKDRCSLSTICPGIEISYLQYLDASYLTPRPQPPVGKGQGQLSSDR